MAGLDGVWKAGTPFYRTGFSNGPLQRLISKAVVEGDMSKYRQLLEEVWQAGKRVRRRGEQERAGGAKDEL